MEIIERPSIASAREQEKKVLYIVIEYSGSRLVKHVLLIKETRCRLHSCVCSYSGGRINFIIIIQQKNEVHAQRTLKVTKSNSPMFTQTINVASRETLSSREQKNTERCSIDGKEKDKQSASERGALIYYGWKLILFSIYRWSAIIIPVRLPARDCGARQWWMMIPRTVFKADNLRPRAREMNSHIAERPAGVGGTSLCLWTAPRQSARAPAHQHRHAYFRLLKSGFKNPFPSISPLK